MADIMHSINRWIRMIITVALILATLNALFNLYWPFSKRFAIFFGILLFIWIALCILYENKEEYTTRVNLEKAEKELAEYEAENTGLKDKIEKLSRENEELKAKVETKSV